MEEFWIEGYFYIWWSNRSWRCDALDVFIPKYAIKNPPGSDKIFQGKFYLSSEFVRKQGERMQEYIEGKNNLSQKEYYYTKRFLECINKPYEEEEELEPPPTALP